MSQTVEVGTKAFIADGAIPQHARVKVGSAAGYVDVAGLAERDIGTALNEAFAAGDIVQSMKQIVVAVGQGAIAADSAYRYIRSAGRKQGFV